MKARLFSREVLPFYGALLTLVGATLLSDAVLHLMDAQWIGRWLGIPGTLLILGSLGYSLRKHKLIRRGHPARLLRWHEFLAWAGSLMVLVHAGVHFNAILAWLAVAAMLVNVGSGLTGKFLLDRSRQRLEVARQRLRQSGMSDAELDERVYWDSLTFDVVKRWRAIHFPITYAFAVLALAHIVAVLLFWSWR